MGGFRGKSASGIPSLREGEIQVCAMQAPRCAGCCAAPQSSHKRASKTLTDREGSQTKLLPLPSEGHFRLSQKQKSINSTKIGLPEHPTAQGAGKAFSSR